ncbi:MAG: pseudouridine synthase [Chitinophagales bacterium]|nr:pseudouridine synthase [Chitinophagales bacterium]MBP9795436.1 pseudouridine synthase [Chitinophagales bacterium]
MKRTNNRTNRNSDRPTKRKSQTTNSRKRTEESPRTTSDRKRPEIKGDVNKKDAAPKSNPNRKQERLERAKKYSKKPDENGVRHTPSLSKKNTDTRKPEVGEIKKPFDKKPFHSKFSEPQRYDLKKEDIKNARREEKKSRYGDKTESKRTFKENRNHSKDTDRKRFSTRNEDKENRFSRDKNVSENKREEKESGKTKFVKNLQKFSEKRKLNKKPGFVKNPSTLNLSKPTPLSEDGTRLNKYLANSGVAARRKCDEIIEKGEVTVNGKVVREMGYKVKPGDSVKYKNKPIKPVNYVYILLNKPKDYLTTVDDDKGRNTVMELISNATTERVFPVGRLDRNTTGLLLLTNDGDLAQKLAHPSFGAKKIYEVEVDKPVTQADMQKISDGVMLEDGLAIVDGIDYAHHTQRNILGISLHIGKNRIVRRIFESLGYKVERLDRTLYAGLTKRDLPRGRWRYLTEREIIKLKYLK